MNISKNIAAVGLAVLMLAPAAMRAERLNLTAQGAREMALAHDETLRKARNAVDQADLDVKIANTARLPKLEGSASAMYMVPDMDMMGMKLQFRGAYVAGLQIMQPIYAGGKITAGRKLAGIGSKAAREQVRMSEADVLADADNAYWTLVAVRSKLALMESFRNMIDTLYDQTSVAVETGMTVGSDLLRIEAKRSEILYQSEKVANGAELCRMALCNIIGAGLDTEIVLSDSVPECTPPGDLAADVATRPEYHLLELQLEAARQKVNLTRGDFLPTVGLGLSYNYYGNIKLKGMADLGGGNYMPYTQEYRDGIGMGMLSVSIPLFHWGEGMKKVKKAKIEVENAALDLTRTRDLLDLEVRQAASNVADGWNMISAARVAVDQAAENLRVMRDRYDESMSTLTDLLDAQNQWLQSQSNLIEALTQYRIYQTAWLKAAGRL